MIISRPTMSMNAVAISASNFAGIFRTSRHKHVEQANRNCDQHDAKNWRLKRLGKCCPAGSSELPAAIIHHCGRSLKGVRSDYNCRTEAKNEAY